MKQLVYSKRKMRRDGGVVNISCLCQPHSDDDAPRPAPQRLGIDVRPLVQDSSITLQGLMSKVRNVDELPQHQSIHHDNRTTGHSYITLRPCLGIPLYDSRLYSAPSDFEHPMNSLAPDTIVWLPQWPATRFLPP